jgi:UDPglucose 6-dehydrogenase
MARADELGVGSALGFLSEVDQINLRRRQRVVDLATELVGGSVEGKRIAVLGLAFKPDSDDVRDSPALDVASRLADLGAIVTATDPQAIETSRRIRPELDYVADPIEAVEGADAVLLLTEWKQYRELDPEMLGSAVHTRAIVDGRNCLDAAKWRAAGWTYRALGRP